MHTAHIFLRVIRLIRKGFGFYLLPNLIFILELAKSMIIWQSYWQFPTFSYTSFEVKQQLIHPCFFLVYQGLSLYPMISYHSLIVLIN